MDKQEQQLAKPKNEVRVAAGRKLVEKNRKNKENLIKNKAVSYTHLTLPTILLV